MIIKSVSNQNYKLINRLKNKKYREKENLFIIESRKLVDEAISSSANIDFIFLRSDVSYETNLKSLVFDKALFNKLTMLKSSDGIGAVIRKPVPKKISSKKVLLLDSINDPGNIGTMIRSAEAFGFNDIILSPDCVDIYNEKALRASMGSVFRLNIVKLTYDEIANFKDSYKFLAADMSGLDIREYKSDSNIILAIGNEANGLGKEVRSLTDTFVKIPMEGDIESLNAAIAASIIMNRLM
ncbi:RNA methyltransferase [Anaerococcus sp. NML200574]|uniref:TrmH family RNA methyltransferase n=1 Tax=Anaerococcus sp. NML200574 TaxID=2954486 RepID=UPI002237F69E|nr:RNA methyltransferase [Anaerococcus sp. NML200574]MCW6678910.1 RNA methyltransferase [Anaerococcus sp. NML200574]